MTIDRLDHDDQVHDSGPVPRTYQIAEAKAQLSEILRQVKRGRVVTIAERGKPIARVVPIERTDSLRSRVAQLEQEGVIVRGRGALDQIKAIGRRPGALRRFLATRS